MVGERKKKGQSESEGDLFCRECAVCVVASEIRTEGRVGHEAITLASCRFSEKASGECVRFVKKWWISRGFRRFRFDSKSGAAQAVEGSTHLPFALATNDLSSDGGWNVCG